MITGAAGFAGSFLVEHYASRGWNVHGTDRNQARDLSWAPDGVHFHRIDLLDRASVFGLIADVQPDVVHHLAAQSSVSMSWNDPLGTLSHNSSAQHNVLEAINALRPAARVLVVGSCDEYGNVPPERNPIRETEELLPLSPYGLSKVAQDLMGYQFFAVHGLEVVRARPFLQMGPRRAARFVAGSFARQVAEIECGLREPIISVGTIDLQRDFTDVRDVIRAYALLGEQGTAGDVYNIASGSPHTLRSMLQVMMQTAGVQAEIRSEDVLQRGVEPPVLVGDASKLRSSLGWQPSISFETSARDTIDYWRDYVKHTLIQEGGS